jgi:membrane protein DedA with SNARE-associated domain
MTTHLFHQILGYGYLAIFLIVFLQELGLPTPVPNEFSLYLFGYLSHQGNLQIGLVLLTAYLAELAGTILLFGFCYTLGPWFAKRIPSWIPFPRKKLMRFREQIRWGGSWRIFICRLTPFIKGYASAAAGLLRYPPRNYLGVALAAACLSTPVYVLAGWISAPYWRFFSPRMMSWTPWVFVLLALAISLLVHWGKSRKDAGPRPGQATIFP